MEELIFAQLNISKLTGLPFEDRDWGPRQRLRNETKRPHFTKSDTKRAYNKSILLIVVSALQSKAHELLCLVMKRIP